MQRAATDRTSPPEDIPVGGDAAMTDSLGSEMLTLPEFPLAVCPQGLFRDVSEFK